MVKIEPGVLKLLESSSTVDVLIGLSIICSKLNYNKREIQELLFNYFPNKNELDMDIYVEGKLSVRIYPAISPSVYTYNISPSVSCKDGVHYI